VFVCPGILHRLPSLWSDPNDFIIDRWIDGRDASCKDPYAYMPFLVGPHACIGRRFARLEACTALAVLLQKFNFASVPGRKVTSKLRITQRPDPSLHLMVSLR
jgi:cytochrome P450 / NADPH-cytochrome P450 reductase